MNKQLIALTFSCFICIGFESSAFAQWDLGGIPANTMQSAGGGQGGYRDLDQNGLLQQPYTSPNAIQPNREQAIYDQHNQRGYIQNTNRGSLIPDNYTTPYVNSIVGGGGALPMTSMPALSPMQGLSLPSNLKGVRSGGLPPTTLDSFVRNAGGAAARIYGDEGTNSWPPMNGFPESSSINAGIVGLNNKTITTGHGSKLPAPSQVYYNRAGQLMTQSGPRDIHPRQRRKQPVQSDTNN